MRRVSSGRPSRSRSGSTSPEYPPDICVTPVLLGRRWPASHASGAQGSTNGTDKRRSRWIAQPAESGGGGVGLRPAGAVGEGLGGLSPHAGQLDERGRGAAHVLDTDPLALAVRVVAAREDVRRRQAHLGEGRAVGAAADRRLLRLETDAPDRLLEVRADLGIPLERGARVAVLDAVVDLDRAARLGGADVVREAGQKGDVLGEAVVVEVAHAG